MEGDTDSVSHCYIGIFCHTPEINSDYFLPLPEYFGTNQSKEHCAISNKFYECDSPQQTFDLNLPGQRFYMNSEKCESFPRLWTACVDALVLSSKRVTESLVSEPTIVLVASPMPLSTFEKCTEGDTLLKMCLITSPTLPGSLIKIFEDHCSKRRLVKVQTLQQLPEKEKCCIKALNRTASIESSICSNVTRTPSALTVRQNYLIDDTIHDSFDPHSSISTPPMPETRNGYIVLKGTPGSGLKCQSAGKANDYKDDAMKQIQSNLFWVYHRLFSFTWSYVSLRLPSFMFAEANNYASNTAEILLLGMTVCRNAIEATRNTKGNTNMETVMPLIIYMHAQSCQIHENVPRSALPQTSNVIIHYIILSRASTPRQRLDDVRRLSMTHSAVQYESFANKSETHLVQKRNLQTHIKGALWLVLTSIKRPHEIQSDTRTRKENKNVEKEWNPSFQSSFSSAFLEIRLLLAIAKDECKSVSAVNEPNTQQSLNKYADPDLTSNRERYSHTNKLTLRHQVLQNGTAKTKTTKKDKKISRSCCNQLPATAEFRKWILKTNVAQATNIQQSKAKTQPIQIKAFHPNLSKKTKGNYIDPHLTKLPVKKQVMQDITVMVKANQNEVGLMKPFFRQPPITTDFQNWTVAMMKTNISKSAILQPPTILGQPGMQNEWNRLATFASFDVPKGIFVILLAGNGFFLPDDSLGKSTKESQVECAFCSVVVHVAMFVHVKPMDIHRKVSPRCRFALGQKTGNLSIADVAQITGSEFIKQFEPAWAACSALNGSEMTSGLQNGSENTLVHKDMQRGLEITPIPKRMQSASQTTLIPKGLHNGSAMTPTSRGGQGVDLAVDGEQPAVARLAEALEAAPSGKPGASFALSAAPSSHRKIPESTGNVVSDSHAAANSKSIGDCWTEERY